MSSINPELWNKAHEHAKIALAHIQRINDEHPEYAPPILPLDDTALQELTQSYYLMLCEEAE